MSHQSSQIQGIHLWPTLTKLPVYVIFPWCLGWWSVLSALERMRPVPPERLPWPHLILPMLPGYGMHSEMGVLTGCSTFTLLWLDIYRYFKCEISYKVVSFWKKTQYFKDVTRLKSEIEFNNHKGYCYFLNNLQFSFCIRGSACVHAHLCM